MMIWLYFLRAPDYTETNEYVIDAYSNTCEYLYEYLSYNYPVILPSKDGKRNPIFVIAH